MAVQMLTVSDLKKMQSVNPETVDRSASRSCTANCLELSG
jgi:hypothetical protein